MNKAKQSLALLLGSLLLSGCDSSYHAFDGQSGFKFQVLEKDRYALQYFGSDKNTVQDVEQMWHHTAREVCRSGTYLHQLNSHRVGNIKGSGMKGGNIIPKSAERHIVTGIVLCGTPNFANKMDGNKGLLLGEDLSANEFKSRGSSH